MKQLSPIDESVKIPDAVKASAARAEEAFKAQYQTQAETDGVQETQQEAPAASTEVPLTKTAETASQEVASTAEPVKAKQEDDQSWEHRYKSMKGRYERSEAQIRTLSEQVTNLQNVIATLQTAPQPFSQEDDADYSTSRLITPEEEKDYGSEFLSVVGKKAKEELTPEVSKLRKEIAGLKQQLNGVGNYVAGNARERMENAMNDQLPNWKEVNVNPEFLNWLKLPDAYSGAIRHELLKAAYERNDTPRVLAFFKGFLAEEAATNPADRGPDLPDGASVQQKVSLESLAAPGRAKTAAASSAPAEKPSFTRAQISKFYADSAAGRYRGREAEKDRIERQIFDAERDGRIR